MLLDLLFFSISFHSTRTAFLSCGVASKFHPNFTHWCVLVNTLPEVRLIVVGSEGDVSPCRANPLRGFSGLALPRLAAETCAISAQGLV